MKRLLLITLSAAAILVGPGVTLPATAAVAQNICDGEVPPSWRRPGGYCEQLGGGSLSEPVDGCPTIALLLPHAAIWRLRVADAFVDPCSVDPCAKSTFWQLLPVGDRVLVATAC